VHGQGSSLAAGQLNGPNLKREWSCMCFCVATLIFLVLLCFSVFAYAFLVELFHFFLFGVLSGYCVEHCGMGIVNLVDGVLVLYRIGFAGVISDV